MKTFYSYIYFDPSRNDEPIYVGKGHGNRAWKHLKKKGRHPFIQRLQFMKKNNVDPDIKVIQALNEDHAFFIEECLIKIYGRKDLKLGPLLNLTNGGDGVSNPSPLTRAKIGAANKGIKRTAAQIKANSEFRKGKPTGRKGKPNPMKKTTPHKNNGKVRTQEFKDNLSKLHVGKTAWNKGKPAKKKSCVHCSKMVDAGNMKKHHGDNCKNYTQMEKIKND